MIAARPTRAQPCGRAARPRRYGSEVTQDGGSGPGVLRGGAGRGSVSILLGSCSDGLACLAGIERRDQSRDGVRNRRTVRHQTESQEDGQNNRTGSRTSRAAAMELRVGNRYRLGRKIGSGSFGDIYLGKEDGSLAI